MAIEVDGPEHVFADSDLIYSARSRCSGCGSGFAYCPSVSLMWDCSAILLGTAIPAGLAGAVVHDDPRPFVFAGQRIPQESPELGTTRPGGPRERRLIIP